jgi:hypothetical protein
MFTRRLGSNGPLACAGGCRCPDILELESGDFAIIGTDITPQAIHSLPTGSGCGIAPQVSALLWFKENWSSLLQGVGIIAGLFFTAISIRRDTRSRRVSDLLTLTEQHRNLWNEVHERDGLRRIYDAEVDFLAHPITDIEEEFLNRVIVHFSTGWLLAREGSLLTLETLAEDVRWFFNLPIPKRVWEATKEGRDRKFIKFVETALKHRKKTNERK